MDKSRIGIIEVDTGRWPGARRAGARGGDLPRALVPVAGLPLIERLILSARRAGVRRFFLLGGGDGGPSGDGEALKQVRAGMRGEAELGVELHWRDGESLDDAARSVGAQQRLLLIKAGWVTDPVWFQRLVDRPERVVTLGGEGRGVYPIDSPADLRSAERGIFRSLVKPTDGFISRSLNRRLSASISRILVRTPVTPNALTAITLLLGLSTAAILTLGGYWAVAAGATLFQLVSIFDGCDGEIARVKFLETRFGEWADSLSDSLCNVLFIAGLAVGLYRVEQSLEVVVLAAITFGGGSMILLLLFVLTRRHTDAAGFDLFGVRMKSQLSSLKWRRRLFALGRLLMKRDTYAFILFVLGILGLAMLMLRLSAIAVVITGVVVAFNVRRIFIDPRSGSSVVQPDVQPEATLTAG